MSFIALMLRINGDGKPPPFQALHALSDYQKRVSTNVINDTSQPKHKLQGSGCAADRASRNDDETGGEPADRACSKLTIPLLFHKPLKLTIYRSSLTGGTTKHRPANQHRQHVFFAAFFFKRKRVFPALTACRSDTCRSPPGSPASVRSRWRHRSAGFRPHGSPPSGRW